jgi:hypothetical protein
MSHTYAARMANISTTLATNTSKTKPIDANIVSTINVVIVTVTITPS